MDTAATAEAATAAAKHESKEKAEKSVDGPLIRQDYENDF